MECVSADGYYLPNMLILQGKQLTESMYQKELNNETLISVTESGYTNDERALEWLVHFDTYSKRRQQGTWRMLLFDGFGSYCIEEFITYCNQNRIKPWTLPPHSSHILQPLDVVLFQPFKHYYRQAVDAACVSGCEDFNKYEFLAAIESIR